MKKFLSVILALTMVIALIPATFAADADALVYKFCRESYGYKTDITDARKVASYAEIVATDTEPFRMVATTAMSRKEFWEGVFSYSVYKPSTNDSILGFGLVVDKTGAMEASVTYQQKNNSYTADVYLVRNTAINTAADIVMSKNTALNSKDNLDFDSNTTNATYWRNLIKGENVQYLGKVNMQDGKTGESHTVQLENAAIVESGEYYLIFTFNSSTYENDPCYTSLGSFTLTPLPEDTKLTEAFKVTETPATGYVESTVTGLTSDGTVDVDDGSVTGTFTLTAPEAKEGKGNFLYWAKGMTKDKKIVSFSNVLENYMPESDGKNYLVAVYEGDVDTTVAEYYNQNGQRIATRKAGEAEPAKPSMAGYGEAKEWKQYGETNIYVADYEKTKDKRDKVTVTVENGTGGGTVLFGETVTCTADETKGTFKCWTKSKIYGATAEAPEIVSVDKTYTFKAWEDCTVTAVYDVHTPISTAMKIIIDTFDVAAGVTGVMAEFIGLDSAVEKGIMFTDSEENTTKIAMTTKDNQFTVIADETGTYKGYAIVGNATDGYTLITDGEYTK